jgi:hypothetical protein
MTKNQIIDKAIELFTQQKWVSVITNLPDHIDGDQKNQQGGWNYYTFYNIYGKSNELKSLFQKANGNFLICKLNDKEYSSYLKTKKPKDMSEIIQDICDDYHLA